MLYHFLVVGCVDCGLQETQWTNTSRWHGTRSSHYDYEHAEFCSWFCSRLWVFPNDMQHLLLSKKEDIGPLSHSLFTSLAQVRCLGLLSLVQERLDLKNAIWSAFLGIVFAWWLLLCWVQPQSTHWEARPTSWIDLARQSYQDCGYPCCWCTLWPTSFLISFLEGVFWTFVRSAWSVFPMCM